MNIWQRLPNRAVTIGRGRSARVGVLKGSADLPNIGVVYAILLQGGIKAYRPEEVRIHPSHNGVIVATRRK